ncbi:MAG: SMP-30/gluconolactonase/LRE family protein [Lentisphaeria bacterium]|nr:SMP-30/gluconolactonase/LRE family protein [Lentisphaeria bacterium]
MDCISDMKLECGEGPLWDSAAQCLYWTDAVAKAIYVYDRETETVKTHYDQFQAGGITLHEEGGLILGGGEGFAHLQSDGTLRLIPHDCDGIKVDKINDIIADPRGRIFCGQEAYDDDGYEPGYMFRIDPDGTARVIEEGIAVSNGLGFSPDLKTLYAIDSIPRNIYAYDYDIETGDISNRRILSTFAQEDGLPDGMTVDSDGFLWVAHWFGSAVSRLDPDGKLERRIDTPYAQTSSVMFGGADLSELYITSAGLLWESPVAPLGFDYGPERGGPTLRLQTDFTGKEEFKAKI